MKMKMLALVHKGILVMLVLAVSLVTIPVSSAFALGPDEPPESEGEPRIPDERIEKAWERLGDLYERQGEILDRADTFSGKVQELIDRMTENGKDTASLQAALDAFVEEVNNAQVVYDSAREILESHEGFDANGKVTDREQAVETLRELGEKIKEVRQMVGEPGKALREAIRAYRESHRQQEGISLQE
jgi:DNA repair ATPase RecN